MLISELKATVDQALLDFAWRQWAQVGVSANVAGDDGWATDPEALILFTLGIARRDPRLFDEVLDWIALNHRALSLQRLRNLTARFPVDAALVAAVVAWARQSVPTDILVAQDPASYTRPTAGEKEQQAVFSPDVLGFIARADPIFAKHGFIRPVAVRSGKSREPDTGHPVNFAFRLRHLFGPGSRSEVMRVLLTYRDGPLDAARIADEAAFAKRNISEALASVAAAGAVSFTWAGNERLFRARRDPWATLLGLADTPLFVSWVHLLPAALEISLWLDERSDAVESEYLVASQVRRLLDRVGRDLQSAGIEVPRQRSAPSSATLSDFEITGNAVLAALNTGIPR